MKGAVLGGGDILILHNMYDCSFVPYIKYNVWAPYKSEVEC